MKTSACPHSSFPLSAALAGPKAPRRTPRTSRRATPTRRESFILSPRKRRRSNSTVRKARRASSSSPGLCSVLGLQALKRGRDFKWQRPPAHRRAPLINSRSLFILTITYLIASLPSPFASCPLLPLKARRCVLYKADDSSLLCSRQRTSFSSNISRLSAVRVFSPASTAWRACPLLAPAPHYNGLGRSSAGAAPAHGPHRAIERALAAPEQK